MYFVVLSEPVEFDLTAMKIEKAGEVTSNRSSSIVTMLFSSCMACSAMRDHAGKDA